MSGLPATTVTLNESQLKDGKYVPLQEDSASKKERHTNKHWINTYVHRNQKNEEKNQKWGKHRFQITRLRSELKPDG
jgi:hypothetical protein